MPEGFKIASAFVTVDPDAADFKEKLQAVLDEAVAGIRADVPVGLDTAELDAQANDVRDKMDELGAKQVRPKLGLDKEDFEAGIGDAEDMLDELGAKEAKPKLGLDKEDFDTKLGDAEDALDDMDAKRAAPKLDLDTADFDAKLAAARASLSSFGSSSASPRLGASGGAGAAESGGGGGLLGGLVGGAAALMPGIGGAAMGLGMLGGVGAMALGGVAKAVSAAHQAAQNLGMTSQQLAATEFSNSVQIQQAQQAIGQAHMQAAADAVNSSQQIIAAEQAVGQAEHNLSDAQFAETQAQAQLTEARIQARLALQQLQDQVKDAALNEQAASLAVQQAKYQQQLVDQNAYSTQLDRQQASLAVAQAEQHLTEAQQARSNATMEASGKDRQFFDGQQQVIQAEHALKDAHYAVAQAVQQVANAHRALSVAEQNAAFTQERDAAAIASAQQNLTDTIKQQQLQMAATRSEQNQAALQFQRDMSRLTPAARGLVNQILSMRGAWRTMTSAAQNAVAPGLTIFLRGVKSLLPDITFAAKDMGGAISAAFGQFGKQMQTTGFSQIFRGLIRNGVDFASIVLPAFAQFVQELAKIGSANGAVSGLANLLAGIGHGLTGLVASIGHYTGSINLLLTLIGRVIAQAGPALGNMLGTAVRVISPILSFLNSPGGKPFTSLLGDILGGFLAWKVASFAVIGPVKSAFGALQGGIKWLKELPGNIKGWWGNITGFFTKFGSTASKIWGGIASTATSAWSTVTSAASSAASGIGSALSTAGGWVTGFGSKIGSTMASAGSSIASFVSGLGARLASAATATGVWIAEHTAATATFIAENVAQAASATAAYIAENAASLGLVAAITAVVAGVIYLATHWQQAWDAVKTISLAVWHDVLDPMWHAIKAGTDMVYQDALLPLWHGFTTVLGGIKTGAQDFVSALGSVWDRLEGVFKTPVAFLVNTVYDNGIARLWNDVVGAVGLGSLKLPTIHMAGGGIVPGRDTGRDTVMVGMRPEEGVLTPEAVRGIGGPGTVFALNDKFSGSRAGPHAAQTPGSGRPVGFGGGGILGDIGGFLGDVGSGLWHGIKDAYTMGRIVAALASGNPTAFTNAIDALIGTKGATGDLAKVMIGLPKSLFAHAAEAVAKMFGLGGGSGSVTAVPGSPSGSVLSWFQQAAKITKAPSSWIPGLEKIAYYESSYNPNAVNRTAAGIAAGLPEGIMQTIGSTFAAYHAPGTSWNIFDPVADIAAAIGYIRKDYGSPYNTPGLVSLSHGGPYTGYDSGGWLPPGMPTGMPVNTTGQPEAVLTPDQSQALIVLARSLAATGSDGASALRPVQVNQYYSGSIYPSPEQLAIQRRDLAMQLGA